LGIMMDRRVFLTSSIAALARPAEAAEAAAGQGTPSGLSLYVSPRGDDAAPGTSSRPLGSLKAAQRQARRLRKLHPDLPIRVVLSGGVYGLDETLILTQADASRTARTVWQAAPGETPVLSSGAAVSDWQRCSTPPQAPPEADGKIWVADLPENIDTTNVLFDAEGILPRAATAAFSHARRVQSWTGTELEHLTIPVTEPERLAQSLLPSAQGAEVKVVGAAPWTMNFLMVASVEHDTIKLARPSTYAMAAPCAGQVFSDTPIGCLIADCCSKALGGRLPSLECSRTLL
jgi:hypothetical protein